MRTTRSTRKGHSNRSYGSARIVPTSGCISVKIHGMWVDPSDRCSASSSINLLAIGVACGPTYHGGRADGHRRRVRRWGLVEPRRGVRQRACSSGLEAFFKWFGKGPATWIEMYRDACTTSRRGEQSGAMLDERMACLDRRGEVKAAGG